MLVRERLLVPPAQSGALAQMFEARKQVFVDLLKWDLALIDNRFEVDQFDDCHARYLIISDEARGHLGSARILPSERPHILGHLFPELSAQPVPTGPGIAEITRFCLGRNQSAADRRHTRNRLVSAIVTHALERDIGLYTGVAELGWLQQILAFGWVCRPLGPPQRIGGHLLGALAIEIDANTPALLSANGLWIDEPANQRELEAA